MNLLGSKPVRTVLKASAGIFLAAGGLSIIVGGRALHEIAGVDRFFAEWAGIAGGAALVLVGLVLKNASEGGE